MSKSNPEIIINRLRIATVSSPIAVFNFYGQLWSCFASTVCSQMMIKDGRFFIGIYHRDSIAQFKIDIK